VFFLWSSRGDSYFIRASLLPTNGLRYEHVAGFGANLYQNTPKLETRLKAK
jgi:hypothetical protein